MHRLATGNFNEQENICTPATSYYISAGPIPTSPTPSYRWVPRSLCCSGPLRLPRERRCGTLPWGLESMLFGLCYSFWRGFLPWIKGRHLVWTGLFWSRLGCMVGDSSIVAQNGSTEVRHHRSTPLGNRVTFESRWCCCWVPLYADLNDFGVQRLDSKACHRSFDYVPSGKPFTSCLEKAT